MAAERSAEQESARLAGGIYGTITVTAVVVAASDTHDLSPAELAVAVVTTALVLWVAHVYADVVAQGVAGHRLLSARSLRWSLRREWPLVESAIPPTVALLLAPLGLVSDATAEWLALAAGVLSLFAWGIALGRRASYSPAGTVLLALANAGLGLAIVALKGLGQ